MCIRDRYMNFKNIKRWWVCKMKKIAGICCIYSQDSCSFFAVICVQIWFIVPYPMSIEVIFSKLFSQLSCLWYVITTMKRSSTQWIECVEEDLKTMASRKRRNTDENRWEWLGLLRMPNTTDRSTDSCKTPFVFR